jgi:hypothetical protein
VGARSGGAPPRSRPRDTARCRGRGSATRPGAGHPWRRAGSRPRRARVAGCGLRVPVYLGASDETPPPSVRSAIGHRSEQGLFDRRLLLARLQRQPWVELVSVRSLQIVLSIAEGGRFALALTMLPEPSRGNSAASDLHVHLDWLLNHRPSASSDARDEVTPALSAADRCRSRVGPEPRSEGLECRAPSGFGAGSRH